MVLLPWVIENLLIFLMACSISNTISKDKVRPLEIINTSISKDIKKSGNLSKPIFSTRKFTSADEKVVSHIGFAHLTGQHQIRWEWYTPDGNLYQSTEEYLLKAPPGKYVKEGTTHHTINIKNRNAANHTGQWQVKIYLDNALETTETFSLTPEAPLITFTSPTFGTVNQQNITATVLLTDQGGGIGKLIWKVNGRKVGETRGIEIRAKASKELTLTPGKNKVEVIAYTHDSTMASPPKTLDLFYQATDLLEGWYTHQYAIVVGIDFYKESHKLNPLKNAVNDAEAVAGMFKKMGFEVHELYNSQATRGDILKTINDVSEDVHPSDSFCFYFAGHGQGISLESNDREGYIIPYDADIDFSDTGIIKYDNAAISLSRLKRYLEDTRAKHISLLLDSCFSGLVMNGYRILPHSDNINLGYYQNLLARKTINILTSGHDQKVSDGIDHSPFTQAILDGLDRGNLDIRDRDGFVTFNQLALYVKEKVERETNGRQRPQFENLSRDDGDFIFKISPHQQPP
jgi:uncharacterized caspase-like protein